MNSISNKIAIIKFLKMEIVKRHIEEYDKETKDTIDQAIKYFYNVFNIEGDIYLCIEIISLFMQKFEREISYRNTSSLVETVESLNHAYFTYLVAKADKDEIKELECLEKFDVIYHRNRNAFNMYGIFYNYLKNEILTGQFMPTLNEFFEHIIKLINISIKYKFPAPYLIFPTDIFELCKQMGFSEFSTSFYITNVFEPFSIQERNKSDNNNSNINNYYYVQSNYKTQVTELDLIEILSRYSCIINDKREEQYNELHAQIFKEKYGIEFRIDALRKILIGLHAWDIKKQHGKIIQKKLMEFAKLSMLALNNIDCSQNYNSCKECDKVEYCYNSSRDSFYHVHKLIKMNTLQSGQTVRPERHKKSKKSEIIPSQKHQKEKIYYEVEKNIDYKTHDFYRLYNNEHRKNQLYKDIVNFSNV